MWTINSMRVFILLLLVSCTNDRDKLTRNSIDGEVKYTAVEVKEENTTPTVDIEKYTLLVDASQDRREDAKAILAIKRKWPLVMQSPTVAGFDSLLAANFTFTDKGQVLNREAYIKDRTTPSEWRITQVKYENITLQFFNNIALLTYKNRVTNENSITKVIELEHITWADVYEKENNQWKLAAAHVIDFKIEEQ